MAFGFDTSGIRKALDTGNAGDAMLGFYICDYTIPDDPKEEPQEKPEFNFSVYFGLRAAVHLGFARGGLEGWL